MKLTFEVDLTGYAEDDAMVMAGRLSALIDATLAGYGQWELVKIAND